MDLPGQRREYETAGIDEGALDPDPLVQVASWLVDAHAAGAVEPTAAVLATADLSGRPSARTVLVKSLSGQGFVFFTNYRSRKGREAGANPWAALTLTWPELARQVRIEGVVEQVDPTESDAYFASRPRGTQLGAWASEQSQEIPDRAVLEHRMIEVTAEHMDRDVPRPPHWGGLRVVPVEVELWQGRLDRLHDRIVYVPADGEPEVGPGAGARIERWNLVRRSP